VRGVKLISISKCRLQPVEQVANDRQRIRWPRVAPCWHKWCFSGDSRDIRLVSCPCSLQCAVRRRVGR